MSSQPQEPSTLVAGKEDDELVAMVALVRSRAVPVNSIAALLDNVGSAVELVQLSEEDRLFAPPATQHQVIGAVTSEDLLLPKITSPNGADSRSTSEPCSMPHILQISGRFSTCRRSCFSREPGVRSWTAGRSPLLELDLLQKTHGDSRMQCRRRLLKPATRSYPALRLA